MSTISSAVLIPELAVTNCNTSLKFYCDVLGFIVLYERKAEGFAFLERDGAQLMLDEIGKGRTWLYPNAPFEKPLGRGMSLQIKITSITPLLNALSAHNISLFLAPEEKWYQRGDEEIGHRQFIVADPDGYLLRFYEQIGIKIRVMVNNTHVGNL
ncbi:MAG: glyoxalase [Gammaproteobacteria bacterium RIFCSPHIGHO2_02_FULL_39_13]|nr:MAG: glyoxalase [Gammaproteobacteria bacterium RIFCSPHIGHO2_02_FULL_39_13]OGT49901.1 MAG: glyoxalase [Gammaproteobacteria bacterium RIFCSPHIGHO2_12_FULL_39_24]